MSSRGIPACEKSVVRVVRVRTSPGKRLLSAIAPFGLGLSARAPRSVLDVRRRALASQLAEHAAKAGTIIAITGPSGGGKSTLLRDFRRACARQCLSSHVATSLASDRSSVDELHGALPRTLRALASAGLADAFVFARATRDLSDGERARLAIARALLTRSKVIVIDEFASVLDRATARGLCQSLRHALRTQGTRTLIVATAHDDIVDWLAPDVHVVCEWSGPRITDAKGASRASNSTRDAA